MDNTHEGIGFMPPTQGFSNEEVFIIDGHKITVKIVPPTEDNIRCEVKGIFEDGGIHTIAWCEIEYKVEAVNGLVEPIFQVLSDGSMYADSGEIGGWTIDKTGISTSGEYDLYVNPPYDLKDCETPLYKGCSSNQTNLLLEKTGDWRTTDEEEIDLVNEIDSPAYFAEIAVEESISYESYELQKDEATIDANENIFFSSAPPSVVTNIALSANNTDLKDINITL